VLGLHRLGRADGVRRGEDLVVEEVAARAHLHVVAGVAHDDDVLERLEVAHHRIDSRLDGRGLALAPRAVDGDQRLGLRDLHALLDRFGREPAEHDVVRGTDARAGEHRDDDLGDHRQEDPDDVALADAQVLERVREPLHLEVQLGVCDGALLAVLAGPVEGDAVAVAGVDVAVQAVVGHVQRAVGEPFVERRVGVVEHGRERLVPVQGSRLLGPVGVGVERGPFVQRGVGDARGRDEVRGRREALLVEERLEPLLELVAGEQRRRRSRPAGVCAGR
jgi:hypothetical protein